MSKEGIDSGTADARTWKCDICVSARQLLRFVDSIQVAFFHQRSKITFFAAVIAALWGTLPGCNRALSEGGRAERAQLRQALREQAYDRAASLAERVVQRYPAENGAWDRLLQAQFGKRDLDGAKTTLERWRRAIRKPSVKIDEYAGDLAIAEHKPAEALQHWREALHANDKNLRMLEKIARLEQSQRHWLEENNAWTALLAVQESAEARVQRALCRRRLHRWDEAWEDVHKAQETASYDPEVLRATTLFDRLSKQLAKIRDLDARLAVAPNDAATITDRSFFFCGRVTQSSHWRTAKRLQSWRHGRCARACSVESRSSRLGARQNARSSACVDR